ncbi:MAG TPA: hypothetical protein VJI68_00970 [Candidatus Nanoarchaeia archaeon]|nr:hypothetical protein [Candidatus Nanoarchaeia archaeon]
MLEKIKENYEKIKESKKFDSEEFLCGVFAMSEVAKIENAEITLDFYNFKTKTITSYKINQDVVSEEKNQDVFKKEDAEIEELKLEEIKVEFSKVKDITEDILLKRKEIPVKVTLILQKVKVPIWNLIYITRNFNLINVKINAIDGEVIEEKTISLLSFEKS